ncbi:MAG: hypothetical protein ABSE48_19720 [Verrucomicrobiota bacterium]
MDAEGLLHQQPFTVVVTALELDLKGFVLPPPNAVWSWMTGSPS